MGCPVCSFLQPEETVGCSPWGGDFSKSGDAGRRAQGGWLYSFVRLTTNTRFTAKPRAAQNGARVVCGVVSGVVRCNRMRE